MNTLPLEPAASRFDREYLQIRDDRKARTLDLQSEERKSRLFVGPDGKSATLGGTGTEFYGTFDVMVENTVTYNGTKKFDQNGMATSDGTSFVVTVPEVPAGKLLKVSGTGKEAVGFARVASFTEDAFLEGTSVAAGSFLGMSGAEVVPQDDTSFILYRQPDMDGVLEYIGFLQSQEYPVVGPLLVMIIPIGFQGTFELIDEV